MNNKLFLASTIKIISGNISIKNNWNFNEFLYGSCLYESTHLPLLSRYLILPTEFLHVVPVLSWILGPCPEAWFCPSYEFRYTHSTQNPLEYWQLKTLAFHFTNLIRFVPFQNVLSRDVTRSFQDRRTCQIPQKKAAKNAAKNLFSKIR